MTATKTSAYYFRAPCRADVVLQMTASGDLAVAESWPNCNIQAGWLLAQLVKHCAACSCSFAQTHASLTSQPQKETFIMQPDGNGTSSPQPSFKMPQINVPVAGGEVIGPPASHVDTAHVPVTPLHQAPQPAPAQPQPQYPQQPIGQAAPVAPTARPTMQLPHLPQVQGPSMPGVAPLQVTMPNQPVAAPAAVAPPVRVAPGFDTAAPGDNLDAPEAPPAAPLAKTSAAPQSEASRLLGLLFAPAQPQVAESIPAPAAEAAAEPTPVAAQPEPAVPAHPAPVAAPAYLGQPQAPVIAPQIADAAVMPAPPVPVQPQAQLVAGMPEGIVPVVPVGSFGLPESASMNALLTDLVSGGGGEESVDFEAALATVPGLVGGPSEGGFSWHTMANPMSCWRKAYYSHVLGLTPKTTPKALAFGTLYHACWELWYRSGGQRPYDEPCSAVQAAGAPKIAAECRRLVYTELQKYAQQEAEEWDIRAVEQNGVFWSEPTRINGKLVYLPFCCRHDYIIAKRGPGAPCAPAGPVAGGVYIVDRKTAGALTRDLTKGYAMDGQFLMNALVYSRSTEPEMFGPFVGMIFSVAAKHKDPSPDKSFFRVETVVDEDTLEHFYRDEMIPYATEFYRRLFTPEVRNDITKWPKNHESCVGRYGCCHYFDLCDVGGSSVMEAMFKQDPGRQLTLEKLWEPPAEVKRASKVVDSRTVQAESARKAKADHKKRITILVLDAFSAAACSMELFQPKVYMVVGHTQKSVADKLALNLSRAWPVGSKFEFGPDAENNYFDMEITEKGLSWTLKEVAEDDVGSEADPNKSAETAAEAKPSKAAKASKPLSGTLSYRQLAARINRDWWDTEKQPPVKQ